LIYDPNGLRYQPGGSRDRQPSTGRAGTKKIIAHGRELSRNFSVSRSVSVSRISLLFLHAFHQLAPKDYPAQLFAAWRKEEFQIIVSPAIIKESRRVLFLPEVLAGSRATETEMRAYVSLAEVNFMRFSRN
jgi:hypothetical protein